MLRFLIMCSVLSLAVSQSTFAAQKFPYEATVVSDKVEVRCGPGTNFYPTGYVNQQDSVTVYRHDHGGWFMISPPKGSFSWIDAALVEQDRPDHGIIRVEPVDGRVARAMVRIGSSLSDDHSYYGRELSNGDEVTILGEKMLATQRGSVRMFKIRPPHQEFRWIKGEYVVPADQRAQKELAHDPYQIPVEHRVAVIEKRIEEEELAQKMAERERAYRKALYDKLDEIDRRYAEMMELDPGRWNLDVIECDYRQLAERTDETVSALVDKRLAVIERRRGILAQYQNFVRVSAETSRRDEQLAAVQLGYEHTGQQMTSNLSHQRGVQSAAREPDGVHPRLNGAGIVQPLNGSVGGPSYALVAPNGKLLAYLELGPTVQIQQWVGKPSGIVGQRQFDPQYGTDVIKVQRVVPVRLTQ
ncbi:Bacterial SH3 domain protein [Thalassoglobus neptunius]|uniref:Bacterial SH3 domain protein n=1 Tax=Thalassoglobus neptunius TaxID=1938619 RepID=A0A5C5X3H3_9PLAN|nr:SH3 domain-containing protein [Thalassoglobus neptunius]TWT56715.1 Bacterial SH3 domain protein [Thalassoglobus neptunius]